MQSWILPQVRIDKRDYRCREELTGPIDKTEVVIAPPSIYLIPASETVRGNIKIAAQNCYFKETGAFTGEIRCAMFFYPSYNLITSAAQNNLSMLKFLMLFSVRNIILYRTCF
jgi:hypothetical protein